MTERGILVLEKWISNSLLTAVLYTCDFHQGQSCPVTLWILSPNQSAPTTLTLQWTRLDWPSPQASCPRNTQSRSATVEAAAAGLRQAVDVIFAAEASSALRQRHGGGAPHQRVAPLPHWHGCFSLTYHSRSVTGCSVQCPLVPSPMVQRRPVCCLLVQYFICPILITIRPFDKCPELAVLCGLALVVCCLSQLTWAAHARQQAKQCSAVDASLFGVACRCSLQLDLEPWR